MRAKVLKKIFLSLVATTSLASCVPVPNTKYCAVAGKLAAGMSCGETLNDNITRMPLADTIAFLEPQQKTDTQPARGGAICMSADDFNKIKTAVEQLCKKVGSMCTYETKKKIAEVSAKIKKVSGE